LSPHALREAQRQILHLARKHNVEVYTETVTCLPRAESKKVEDRARAAGSHGLYLLICKEPPGVQVVVSDALAKKGFTSESAVELKKVAEESVKQRQFDRGLVQSVRFVTQRFETPGAALGSGVGCAGAKAIP